MFYVYGLIDPISNELKYIGKTNNLKIRLRDHINKKNKISHKVNWVKSLSNNNLKPQIIVLEKYEVESDCLQAEIDLIKYFKFLGTNLTNSTPGGDGWKKGMKHSEESKNKISQSHIGLKHTNTTKEKLSVMNSGKNHPQFGTIKSFRKLSNDDVKLIRKLYLEENKSVGDLAKLFNMSHQYISELVNNKKRVL